ncbi:MAG: hypothetical protein ACU0A5_14935 [Salipiger marinus]|uniref:hypothetical protein n=1 Tax=Salipiger marinus TaxID=555512 RepID=UPI004057ED3E
MDEERLIVALEARIRDFEKNMLKAERRGTQSFQGLKRDSRQATTAMEQDMIRSTTRINQALAATSSRIGTFGKAFAAGAVASGMAAFTAGAGTAVRAMADIDREARRAGVSVTAFQELKFIADQNRIDVDAMIDGLKELSLRADEFIETGAGPAEEAFRRLGYGASDLKKRLEEPDELMLDIIGRMEQLDSAAQIRISDELFGGSAGERFVELITHGEGGLRRMRDQAHEFGAVMDEQAIAKAAQLDAEFARVTATLGAAVRQGMLPLAQEALELLDRLRDWREEQAGDRRLADLAEEEVRIFEQLNAVIASAFGDVPNDQLRALLRGNIEDAGELGEALRAIGQAVADYDEGEASFDDMGVAIEGAIDQARAMIATMNEADRQRFGGVIGAINAIAAAWANARAEASLYTPPDPNAAAPEPVGQTQAPSAPVDAVLPNGQRVFRAPATSLRPRMPGVDSFGKDPAPRGGGGGGGSKEPDLDEWQEALAATREEIGRLEAESVSLAVAAQYGTELGDAMEYARKRAELLHAAQQAGREITPQLTAEIDAQAMAYMNAALAAEQNADRLQKLQANAERGADAMSNLFMNILDGSMSAKDAVLQLVAEIARIQTMKLFQNAAATGGGGGLFGVLGGLLSGARAGGGPVNEGGAFLVNENTPRSEVFVPSQSGGVLNVPQAQAALSRSSQAQGPLDLKLKGNIGVTVDGEGNVRAYVQTMGIQAAQQGAREAVRAVELNMPHYMRKLHTHGAI